MFNNKSIFFLSDFHLGIPSYEESIKREKKIVSFLLSIEDRASDIYIVGDMFDFWFEFKHTVPKGFTRILGTLASLSDRGIRLHFFTGNHDMWIKDYFQKELGMQVHKGPIIMEEQGKKIFIGHGDGLGPNDFGYKYLKKFIFKNPLCKWLFSILPSSIIFFIAHKVSRRSKAESEKSLSSPVFLGDDKEWLVLFAKEQIKKDPSIHYFIFGHRHYPIHISLSSQSSYVNLGDWISHFTYAELSNGHLKLHTLSSS